MTHLARRKFDHDRARARWKAGESFTELGRAFGVTPQAIMSAVDDDFRKRKNEAEIARRHAPCNCGTCRRCRHRLALRERNALEDETERQALSRERKRRSRRDFERRRQAKGRPVDPVKQAARSAVSSAVRNGSLIRQPCEECGNARATAHHDDYSKQLDVRWLCHFHHSQVHRRVRSPS